MANAYPVQTVTSPARVPAPYGLFSVLAFREPFNAHWQGGGIKWLSIDGSIPLGVIGPVQEDRETTTGMPKQFALGELVDNAGIFTVYGQQKITPIASTQAISTERARLLLTALEERTIETVLSGAVAGLTPDFTTSPDTVTPGTDIIENLGALENYLATNYGSRGVIHMSRDQAVAGVAAGAMVTKGNGLFTALGTPVVAGSGYTKTKMFATSALVAYRSDIFDNVGQPYDLLDKETNDLYAIAERTYSIGFESAALGVITLS